MKSQTKHRPSLRRLLQQWQREHCELERMISDLRWWASQAGQSGQPDYAEMGEKLATLRDQLFEHFDREVEIGWERSVSSAGAMADLEAIYREAADDHQRLLERLDRLVDRLRQSPDPFESWQDALDELDLFLDSLEGHEEQEEVCILRLSAAEMPSSEAEGG